MDDAYEHDQVEYLYLTAVLLLQQLHKRPEPLDTSFDLIRSSLILLYAVVDSRFLGEDRRNEARILLLETLILFTSSHELILEQLTNALAAKRTPYDVQIRLRMLEIEYYIRNNCEQAAKTAVHFGEMILEKVSPRFRMAFELVRSDVYSVNTTASDDIDLFHGCKAEITGGVCTNSAASVTEENDEGLAALKILSNVKKNLLSCQSLESLEMISSLTESENAVQYWGSTGKIEVFHHTERYEISWHSAQDIKIILKLYTAFIVLTSGLDNHDLARAYLFELQQLLSGSDQSQNAATIGQFYLVLLFQQLGEFGARDTAVSELQSYCSRYCRELDRFMLDYCLGIIEQTAGETSNAFQFFEHVSKYANGDIKLYSLLNMLCMRPDDRILRDRIKTISKVHCSPPVDEILCLLGALLYKNELPLEESQATMRTLLSSDLSSLLPSAIVKCLSHQVHDISSSDRYKYANEAQAIFKHLNLNRWVLYIKGKLADKHIH